MRHSFKTIISLVFLCLYTIIATAQKARTEGQRSGILSVEQPLLIVDSFTTDVFHMLLGPERIESADVLRDSKAMAAYGEQAKYGVIIVRPKKKAKVLNFPELLTQYSIPEADRKLHVCINNILIKDADRLVASRKDIASVEVIKDIAWITPGVSGPEERYINIVTKRSRKR